MSNEEIIIVDGQAVVITDEYTEPYSILHDLPELAKPLVPSVKESLSKVESMLYTLPSFIEMIRATIPVQSLQAVLSDEQKAQIASGALKLMTKKDGSLMACLVNPETSKIVSTIPLENVNLTPNLAQAVTGFATQMQMAQIVEEIHEVQNAIEEVRQGQESDRLATAYSCQQKLLQAMEIQNPQIKTMALMQLAYDAEDSRNLLMQSLTANVKKLMDEPETFILKVIRGSKTDKISQRMNDIREGLSAINMVSLSEAMAYQELGEVAVAQKSLLYYTDYLQETFLKEGRVVERLELLDSNPHQYWSTKLPDIQTKMQALMCTSSAGGLIEYEENKEE